MDEKRSGSSIGREEGGGSGMAEEPEERRPAAGGGDLLVIVAGALAGLALVESVAWAGTLKLGSAGVPVVAATAVVAGGCVLACGRGSGKRADAVAAVWVLVALTMFYSVFAAMVAAGLVDAPTVILGWGLPGDGGTWSVDTSGTVEVTVGDALDRLGSDEGYYLIGLPGC